MYSNPSNIVKTLIRCLDRNADQINAVIKFYEPDRQLNVFEGMRKTLPRDSYPSLEIEPVGAANEWWTTRAQRPRYTFQGTLTVLNDNVNLGVEYISTIMNVLSELITDPTNLQLSIENETRWDDTQEDGYAVMPSRILDSLIDNVTYNATQDGTIRVCQFDWFALVHEPFPMWKWDHEKQSDPTIIRPMNLK